LHWLAIDKCAPHDEGAGGQARKKAMKSLHFFRRQVVERHQMEKSVLQAGDRTEMRLTKLRRAGNHGLEYRLHLGR
jgi:hypothetical protein